jgi:predicted ester cyclase
MSLEENKVIVRRFIAALNSRKLDELDKLMASDYVHHTLQQRGLENYKQLQSRHFKSFPDFHETIEDIIAEGDKVWTLLKITGTHKGEYSGRLPLVDKEITLAPTGQEFEFSGVFISRIHDGKIVESWGVYHVLGFYKKLGVIEYKVLPDKVK